MKLIALFLLAKFTLAHTEYSFPSSQALEYGKVNDATLNSPKQPRKSLSDGNQIWNPSTGACEPRCVHALPIAS